MASHVLHSHQEDEGFGRKPKTNRAKLVVAEAKRALEYINERQRVEQVNMLAWQESAMLSDGMSISSFLARYVLSQQYIHAMKKVEVISAALYCKLIMHPLPTRTGRRRS